jgi:hypothetical protein
MSWFRENHFLGTFLIGLSACSVCADWFSFSAKSECDDATIRFNQAVAELNRLERLAPYPSGENVRAMKAQANDYAASLAKVKDELKTRVFPLQPMAPSEFQSHLRLAMIAVADKARANNVRLPDKFYLGFDEFVSALPSEVAAPLLGQELVQIEWLLDALFDARADTLTSFRRTPLPEEHGTASPPPSAASIRSKTGASAPASPRSLERSVVEATFVSTPAAARKVLNQIAGANEQFCIVRLLHVRNEKDKGPPREVAADTPDPAHAALSGAPAGSSDARLSVPAALNFIVGNERIEVTAKIEMVRFTF